MSFLEPLLPSGNGEELLSSIIMSVIVAAAFLIGSLIPVISRPFSKELKGNVAAIAAGAYFSTIAFSLVEESIKEGAFGSMAIGFIAGALIFSIAHPIVKQGFKHRHILHRTQEKIGIESNREKEQNQNQKGVDRTSNSETSTEMNIIGTILDSVPENIFVGAIIAIQIPGLLAAVLALFVGNLTATIDGAERMLGQGMKRSNIIKKWTINFLIVVPAGPLGLYLVQPLGNDAISAIIGFAAGTLMAFVTVDLIPKAYKEITWHTGLSTTTGFLIVLAFFHFIK